MSITIPPSTDTWWIIRQRVKWWRIITRQKTGKSNRGKADYINKRWCKYLLFRFTHHRQVHPPSLWVHTVMGMERLLAQVASIVFVFRLHVLWFHFIRNFPYIRCHERGGSSENDIVPVYPPCSQASAFFKGRPKAAESGSRVGLIFLNRLGTNLEIFSLTFIGGLRVFVQNTKRRALSNKTKASISRDREQQKAQTS